MIVQQEVNAVSFWPLSEWTRITVIKIGLLVVIVQHEVYAVSFWPLSDCIKITANKIGNFVSPIECGHWGCSSE